MRLYAIYDRVSGTYTAPTYALNGAAMMRSLKQLLVLMADESDNPYVAYPADYCLCEIGEYDDRTALLTPKPVETLCTLADLVQEVK